MATVDGITVAEAQRIENLKIVSGSVDGSGNLILTRKNGETLNVGSIGAYTDGEIATHGADTSTHGVATIAGLTEVQTFLNKTLIEPIIASFVNAQHTHKDGVSGGSLFSGVKALRDASLNIPNDSWTPIYWVDNDEYDTANYHNDAASEHIFTIPENGHYSMFGQTSWEGNNQGRRTLDIRRNDTTNNATAGTSIGRVNDLSMSNVQNYMQFGARAYLLAGDTIKVYAYQNSTSTLQLQGLTAGAALTPYFTIDKVG